MKQISFSQNTEKKNIFLVLKFVFYAGVSSTPKIFFIYFFLNLNIVLLVSKKYV